MKILEGEIQLVATQDWSVLNNMPIEFGVNVTEIPCDGIVAKLKEGESQSIEQAIICAKDYFVSLGYDVEVL